MALLVLQRSPVPLSCEDVFRVVREALKPTPVMYSGLMSSMRNLRIQGDIVQVGSERTPGAAHGAFRHLFVAVKR